jgi:hypothetical protein
MIIEYGGVIASKGEVAVANIVTQQYDSLHGIDLLWGITIQVHCLLINCN